MNDAYDAIEAYVSHVAPHLADRLRRWDSDGRDLFGAYRLDEQIAKALERKVFLPSGGSLIIDRTEAMTVIDVNTGKFTGSRRQPRGHGDQQQPGGGRGDRPPAALRDIGGIIVIDFIDMVLPTNRELLLRRLVECLGRDRTRHQVAEITSLGLVQMTRKKIGTGLLEAFTTECPHCHGRGWSCTTCRSSRRSSPTAAPGTTVARVGGRRLDAAPGARVAAAGRSEPKPAPEARRSRSEPSPSGQERTGGRCQYALACRGVSACVAR